jgi:hypothetical protein
MEAPVLSTTEPVAEQKVSATTGVWSGLPTISYSYQWQRCFSPVFENFCEDIPGATESNYVVDNEYAGQYLRVVVVAENGEGTGEWHSAISGEIGKGNPPPPENTSAPTIEGVAVVGGPLSANPGTWNGASFWSYEWQRCNAEGKECGTINSVEGKTYTPNRGDLGHALRVVVTGNGYVGWWIQASASSGASEPVAEASPPSNESPPTIEGSVEIGETLVPKGGTWSGSATIDRSFVWTRCDMLGRNCEAVSGAQNEFESQHLVSNADAGHTIRLRETATNGWGSVTVMSKPTSKVPPAPALANLAPPEMAFGTPSFHSNFWASRGEWTGVPNFKFQWERCDPLTFDPEDESIECIDIPGATESSIYPSAADIGYKLRLREIASSGKESVTVHSEPTSASVDVGIEKGEATITGLAVSGATITAHSGLEFEAELPSETEYQFWRVAGESYEEVQSGPSSQYEVQNADVGSQIEAYVTLTAWRADKAFVVAERSNWTLTPEVQVGPTNDVPPSISGEAVAGATLEAEPGEWHGGGGPLSYGYQWRLCDEEGKACKDISGANERTYEVREGNVGSTVEVKVTASNGPLSEVSESEPSEIIQPAEAPTVEEAPLVYGETLETKTLEAEPGVWLGSEPRHYTYQWQGCEPEDPASCLDVEDATESTLRLDRSVVGQSMRVVVTATNAAGSASAASELTESVEAAPTPTPTKMPSIDVLGPPAVGSTLMTDGGAWEYVNPDEIEYQWLRCSEGGECQAVEGANNPTYDLVEEDVGAQFEVEVTGENSSGRVSVMSEFSTSIGESTGSAEDKMVYLNPGRTSVYLSDLEEVSPEEITNCESLVGKAECKIYAPKISPNGELITLEVRETGREIGEGAIFVMSFDGTEVQLLAEGSEPSWSADGTQLYLTAADSENPEKTQVIAVSPSGSDESQSKVIFKPARMEGSPDISPDGKLIAYSAAEPNEEIEGELIKGRRSIYVATLAGSSVTRLDLGPRVREAIDPRFTADGKKIVFVALRTDYPDKNSLAFWDVNQLWAVNANGTDPHPISPREMTVFGPPSTHGGEIIAEQQHVTEIDHGGGYSLDYSAPFITRLDPKIGAAHSLTGQPAVEPDIAAIPLSKTFAKPIDYVDCFNGHSPCKPWSPTDRLQATKYALQWSHEGDRNPAYNTELSGDDCTNFVSQVWHEAGQEFMREPIPIGRGPWSWWGEHSNSSQSWTAVEIFIEQQQAQSERAKDLHELPPSQWKLGDVIVLNWDDGGNPHDHLAVVTRVGRDPGISQHSSDRRDYSWKEDRAYTIPRYVEERGGDPHGWRYYVLRPKFKAANIPPKDR